MYPYLRLLRIHLRRPRPADLESDGLLHLRVLPGDADFYGELNNGRQLTLMDLGRIDLARRTGLMSVARREGWLFVVGGASVRYRRRLPLWRRVTLRTRMLGHDERWFYFHQTFERGGKPCSGGLVRGGLRDREGLVPAERVLATMKRSDWNPPLPVWVRDWAAADDLRPEAERQRQLSIGS